MITWKRIEISLLLMLICGAISAQQVVKGKVTNHENRPLPFASVFVINSSVGTITNESGEFEIALNFPEEDSLMISYIGYRSSFISVKVQSKFITVFLQEDLIQLDELLVSPNKLLKNPKVIIEKAVSKLDSSKNRRDFILKGYYKQTFEQAEEYKQLIEAAVSIYNSPTASARFNIDQIRRSHDFRQAYDLQNLSKYNQEQVSSEEMLEFDRQRGSLAFSYWYLNNFKSPVVENQAPLFGNLNDEFVKQHNFKLDTISIIEDDFVYVIKILPSHASKSYFIYDGNDIIPVGKIFIKADDFTILKIEYQYILNPKRKGSRDFRILQSVFGSGVIFKITALYKEFEGYQYLSYLNTVHYSTSKIKNSGQEKRVKNVLERTLLVNKILVKADQVTQEYKKKPWNANLYDRKYTYDEKFWSNYTILTETLTQEKLRKDLEKKAPLSEQFKKGD